MFYREGVCEAVVGNYDAAEYFLLKSIEIDPVVPGYATLGWMYGSILDRNEEAFRCFRKAIRLNPENGDLFNDCGALLLKMGFIPESIKWFHRSIRSPQCSKRHFAFYNLALVYRSGNRPERSCRYLHLALRQRPDFDQARRLLREIRNHDVTAGRESEHS
ncbi:MAG: tetratricopeptide repeat protein [Leptospiraceae bacterium]|nr:tetratricopeptide repeat protein [Leptospiraceae bacterium]